ncbi:MAG: outer membrane protein assembly factor BamD [Myxococcota bacterium]|nr:outer membrane protein assembly factor BamD [Myxococcota bacterium]
MKSTSLKISLLLTFLLSGCVTHWRAREIEARILAQGEQIEQLKTLSEEENGRFKETLAHFARELESLQSGVVSSIDGLRRGSASDGQTLQDLQERLQQMSGQLSELRHELSKRPARPTQTGPQLPDSANELFLYAQSAAESARTPDEIRALLKFRERFPDDPRRETVLYSLAAAYYRQERSEEAFSTLQALLRGTMNPDHRKTQVDEGLYLLHQVRLAQGRCRSAIETLTLLRRKYPQSEKSRQARQKLRQLKRSCRD